MEIYTQEYIEREKDELKRMKRWIRIALIALIGVNCLFLVLSYIPALTGGRLIFYCIQVLATIGLGSFLVVYRQIPYQIQRKYTTFLVDIENCLPEEFEAVVLPQTQGEGQGFFVEKNGVSCRVLQVQRHEEVKDRMYERDIYVDKHMPMPELAAGSVVWFQTFGNVLLKYEVRQDAATVV